MSHTFDEENPEQAGSAQSGQGPAAGQSYPYPQGYPAAPGYAGGAWYQGVRLAGIRQCSCS